MTRARERFLGLVCATLLIGLCACEQGTTPNELDGGAADAAPDQASEAAAPSPCPTIGVTGAAPRCKVFAFCSSGDYELDCNRDDGRCMCKTVTGKGRSDVAYDPTLCALPDGGDPSETSEALATVFAAAVRACEWSP